MKPQEIIRSKRDGDALVVTELLRAHERMMTAKFPKSQLVEAKSTSTVAREMASAIERVRPHQAKLVRMHRYFWLRLWRTAASAQPNSGIHSAAANVVPRIHQVEDVLIRLQPED